MEKKIRYKTLFYYYTKKVISPSILLQKFNGNMFTILFEFYDVLINNHQLLIQKEGEYQ